MTYLAVGDCLEADHSNDSPSTALRPDRSQRRFPCTSSQRRLLYAKLSFDLLKVRPAYAYVTQSEIERSSHSARVSSARRAGVGRTDAAGAAASACSALRGAARHGRHFVL